MDSSQPDLHRRLWGQKPFKRTYYYKQANYQIHSSPTGLYNSLGNIQDERVKCSMIIFWGRVTMDYLFQVN